MNKIDMTKIEYVLFDLDGTLVDSSEGITKSAQLGLKAIGFDVPLTDLLSFIGPSLRYSFGKYTDNPDKVLEALRVYRERYSVTGLFECQLYKGMEELLDALQKAGKKVVLASAKPEEFCVKILKYLNVDKYFSFIGGATFDGRMDDKIVLLEYVLGSIGNPSAESVVMIGDRKFDIEAAKAHHLKSVGVTFGFCEGNELVDAGADFVVDTVAELSKVLLQ